MKINAVFEGGGMKAIGLAGAIKGAVKHGVTFNQVAGTSSGAIIASLLAAGYTADEIRDLVAETSFTSFLTPTILHRFRWVGLSLRLLVRKGLYPGRPIEEWMAELLSAKGVRTFGDLQPEQLRIIASDISRGRMLVLPDDIAYYGMDPQEFSIAEAVRMSTSIPYFFEPVMQPIPGQKVPSYIVDGGLLSNFPLWLFDRRTVLEGGKMVPAIGFYLVGKTTNQPREIYGPLSMFKALFSTMMEAHDDRYLQKHARFRTIKIPTLGVGTTEFDLSREQIDALYESGYEAADRYFDRWSMAKYVFNFDEKVKPTIV